MDCALLLGAIGACSAFVYNVGERAKERFELLMSDRLPLPLVPLPPSRPTITAIWLSATFTSALPPTPASIGNFYSVPNSFPFDLQAFIQRGTPFRFVVFALLVSLFATAVYLFTTCAYVDVAVDIHRDDSAPHASQTIFITTRASVAYPTPPLG